MSAVDVVARNVLFEVWIAPPPTPAAPDPPLVFDYRATSAVCSFGFDQRYAEATITRAGGVPASATPEDYPDPEVGYWSRVEIRQGCAGAAGLVTRFAGYVVPVANELFPQTGTLTCRGALYRAAWVRNQTPGGTLMATPGVGASDEAQVMAVLDACGVAYTPADVAGTGKALGSVFDWVTTDTVTPGPFTWAEGEAGLDYIERLDEVSVPDDASGRYRTFETLGGGIFRIPMATAPKTTPDFTFTEGQDVLAARITRDPAGAANTVTVDGSPVAGSTDAQTQTFTAGTAFAPYLPPGLPNGPGGYPAVGKAFSSPLIEKSALADAGDVVACEAVAQFLLAESNCVVDTLEFSTPRDDRLGPGQTIHLHSPRLGITDPDQHYWLQRLEVSVDEQGAFTQRLTCVRRS